MEIPESQIQSIEALKKPAIIAVSGFGGSGKSTFATELGAKLGAPVVGVDSFMRDRNEQEYSRWEIMDFDRLKREVLEPFAHGANPIEYGHFDWETNGVLETRSVHHVGLIIIEGVGLLRLELDKYFSYKVWVDCPVEEGIKRGKKRDREVHKNPQDENWDGVWKKNDAEYFEAFKPKEMADFVFQNC